TISEKYNKHGVDGLYAAIGAGDVGIDQVINAALAQLDMTRKQRKTFPTAPAKASRYAESEVYIYGVGNLLTRIAHCCSPVPGDQIGGYITSGRGVSVHRKDCGNLLRLQAGEPERVLEVSWGSAPKQVYPVKITLDAYDRSGLLRDISMVLDMSGLNVLAMASKSDETHEGVSVRMDITVEVPSIEALSTVMARLSKIPNMTNVQRVDEY
ncbi:MAG: ACT domain-containing protein, partial [Porticoccus sp.]